jgi:hypothetical protein
MPRPDPLPSRRLSLLRKFRQIMKLMALFAIFIAAIAVGLVARGSEGPHIHMLISTALGAGLSVLLAGALMSLMVLSARCGHHADASQFEKEDEK